MSKHNETGTKGEQIAKNFLINNGYIILHTNWHYDRKEVDIVAHRNNTLVFIEVKTRTNSSYGFPEEAVTLKKQNFLKYAAAAYIDTFPQYSEIRFDVISIMLTTIPDIVHYEGAFY